MPKGKRNTPESFWQRVDRLIGCWPWAGARFASGYGRVRWQGRVMLTHRLAWKLVHGEIPAGLHILHRCDNPPCVRPDHLYAGTPQDNAQDRHQKGRANYQRFNGNWWRDGKRRAS